MSDELQLTRQQLRKLKNPPAPDLVELWAFEDDEVALFEDGVAAEVEG